MEAVERVMEGLLPDALMLHCATHERMSRTTYEILRASALTVVGGTNLLSSRMNTHHQWNIKLADSRHLRDAILLGVGWWKHQDRPNLYTRVLLRRILSQSRLHSVRDGYAEAQLKSIGVENVVDTACPTMWALTPEHCATIPATPSRRVLFTVTVYNQNEGRDRQWIEEVARRYERLYFWPQQPGDLEYMRKVTDRPITCESSPRSSRVGPLS